MYGSMRYRSRSNFTRIFCASGPYDHNSFSSGLRVPCTRKMGENVPNWNHRTNNSRNLGSFKLPPEMNPPISVVQYGIPEIEKFKPAGIWRAKVVQSLSTSPDHAVTPNRCVPAYAERDRMKTRFLSEAFCCPSETPSVWNNG